MKKIIALVSALILCLSLLCSCAGGEKAPDGMQLASVEGEPFKLYVPEEMTLNTQSGISSAFSYTPEKFIISARYTEAPDGGTLEQYMTYCAAGYSESLDEFNMENGAITPDALSGKDALKMIYLCKIDGVPYTCTQISVFYNGDIVSLNFYLPTDKAEQYSSVVDQVKDEFVLCERKTDLGDTVTDKKTPEGMKIASADDLEYRLYVPLTWICSSESGRSEAYFPESGKTNVTVTSFSPEEGTDTAEYIANCEEEFADTISGYELIEKTERKVAERDAISLTFKAVYDGISFKIMQTSFSYGGMIYSVTYTAIEENFELHTEDLDKILSEFKFR